MTQVLTAARKIKQLDSLREFYFVINSASQSKDLPKNFDQAIGIRKSTLYRLLHSDDVKLSSKTWGRIRRLNDIANLLYGIVLKFPNHISLKGARQLRRMIYDNQPYLGGVSPVECLILGGRFYHDLRDRIISFEYHTPTMLLNTKKWNLYLQLKKHDI